jgi:uncharacterized protein YggE
MGGKVTVSVRSILLAALVGLGLVTAYLLGGQGGAVTAPASAAPEKPSGQRLMRMVGTGEATAVPDQISFSLSAAARRPDLDDAMAASSATMARILAELGKHGVERSDVQTTGLSMSPVYEYHAYEPPTLVGYRVTQRAAVHVDELTKGGPAISAAVEVGGNGVRVSGIKLGIADPDAVLARARDAAVESATARPPRPQFAYRGALDGVELTKALPIRAGKDDLQVRIQVAWEFE